MRTYRYRLMQPMQRRAKGRWHRRQYTKPSAEKTCIDLTEREKKKKKEPSL